MQLPNRTDLFLYSADEHSFEITLQMSFMLTSILCAESLAGHSPSVPYLPA